MAAGLSVDAVGADGVTAKAVAAARGHGSVVAYLAAQGG